MNDGRPRIAILHYTAPPVVGGVEAVLAEHTRLFVDAGYPTTVVVGRGGTEGLPKEAAIRVIPQIDSQDTQILRIAAALDRGEVPVEFDIMRSRIESALANALADADIVIAHNVMTMHFNLPLTAALHRLLDQRRRFHFIAWTHDASWDDPWQRPHVRPGKPWDLLRKARHDVTYVVISRERQAAIARAFNYPQYKLRVIPNGVSVRFWWNLSPEGDELITKLGLLDGDIFLLQPARITRLKNIAYALRIVAAMKARGLAPRFVVTGPPDPHDPAGLRLLAELRALRRELDLEREAFFLSEEGAESDGPRILPFTTVRDLYQACDAILLPSFGEGFGVPVIEAGLIGRPVFCADIPPFREIGSDLVHRFDLRDDPAAAAARIMVWAERDRAHKMRRRVWRHFTWRVIMQDHLEPLINSTMGTAGA